MASVLIIDDSRTSRRILQGVLEKSGSHTVIGEAANGIEGVELFRKLRPDIVTLDITMPIMNGLEALRAIMKEDKEAKVIMITVAGQKEMVVQAIRDGATDFIAKPFEPEQVIEALKRALR